MTAQVELHGVRFAYPDSDRDALSGMDLTVGADETVCVLGPSGSGKSTLLRVVAGLDAPTGGSVRIGGVDQRSVPAHRRDLAMLFQSYALFPHRDVGGNVAYGLQARRTSRDVTRQLVADALSSVGLDGWQDRRVDTLSGGEAQRVALARALVLDPPVLLLDEPLGALDRTWRDELVAQFRDVFRNRCVLYVTHDPAEAFALADRVAVLCGGQVVQCAPVAELWTSPASSEVARLIGLTGIHDAVLSDAGAGTQTVRLPWFALEIPATTVSPGSVKAMVRPTAWEVAIVDDAPTPLIETPGTADGTVVDDRFADDHRRLRVALTGNAGDPTGVVEVRVPLDSRVRAGDRVRCRVDPADVLVMPD